MHPELEAHRLKGRYVSVFPGRRAIHLAVVLRQVTLHPIHIRCGNVDATASALHDAARRHHSARYRQDFAVDDIADQQLVRREIVLLVRVVPDMVSRYL